MGVAGLSLTYTRPMPQFSPILIFFFKYSGRLSTGNDP